MGSEGNSSEEEEQSSDFEPSEGEYKAKKTGGRGVRGSAAKKRKRRGSDSSGDDGGSSSDEEDFNEDSPPPPPKKKGGQKGRPPAKSKYVDPDSDEDFDQPTERLDLDSDQTRDLKIAPLVGKKIRGNYETGWHYGKIEYFNVKMQEYKVSFADGLDPDYIKESDIDGVDIILLDDELPTNGNNKSVDKKGDSEGGESDQEGSGASDEEGSGTENKRSTKVLDDNSRAKAATTPTKKKGGSSGEESENNESDEEMEENSEIPEKTTLQA